MIKINILDLPPRHKIMPVPADWYPLHINRSSFRQQGIDFDFSAHPSSTLTNCDILFLSSRWFTLQQKSATELGTTLSQLDSWSKKTKIIWFDFRDSSGSTQFEVLPYVDLYLKNQLLKDFSLYRQSFYGQRIYTDFIHQHFNINDDYNEPYHPLPPEFSHKIGLSWNLGLLDLRGGTNPTLIWHLITDYLEKRFSFPHQVAWRSPNAPRPHNMLARFNTNYARQTVAWQRRHVSSVLRNINDPLIIFDQPMSLRQEINYRRHSKIILSLFGWGEICSRDFHTFIAGAALLAPDTSHLVTWPTTHIPYKTYYPFRWDLSNLSQSYHHLINNDAQRLAIARAGQDLYRHLWSPAGKKEFVTRLTKIITDLLNTGHSPTARP